jgi:hypothetical protein
VLRLPIARRSDTPSHEIIARLRNSLGFIETASVIIEVYCSIIGIRCQQKTTRLGSYCLAASPNETDLAPVQPYPFLHK